MLDHWCEEEDRDPRAIARGVNVAFAMAMDDVGVAQERASLEREWGSQSERILAGSLLCTPSEALDRVMGYVESGADAINVALRAPWDEDALGAYLDEVMPAVRKAAT